MPNNSTISSRHEHDSSAPIVLFIDDGSEEDEIIERLQGLRRQEADDDDDDDDNSNQNESGRRRRNASHKKFILQTQFSLLESSVADELIKTLEWFSGNTTNSLNTKNHHNDRPPDGRRWNVGRFHFDGFARQEQRVLSHVLELGLFERIEIKFSPGCRGAITDNSLLADLFQQHKLEHLDFLRLEGIQMSYVETQAFARSLAGPHGPKELRFINCSFKKTRLECREKRQLHSPDQVPPTTSPEEDLARGLADNLNLCSLTIEHAPTHDDLETATILQGLVGHPSLKELTLNYTNLGPRTIEVLHRILSNPLSSLRICSRGSGGGDRHVDLDVQSFFEKLPRDNRLETFGLKSNNVNADTANFILRNLKTRLPHLRTLDLGFNWIVRWDRLTKDLLVGEDGGGPHHALRSLILCNNGCGLCLRSPTTTTTTTNDPSSTSSVHDDASSTASVQEEDEDHLQHLMDLLLAFPGLGDLGKQIMDDPANTSRLPTSMVHQLDMNRCCGPFLSPAPRTMTGTTTTTTAPAAVPPVAIWPRILQRVNRDTWLAEKQQQQHPQPQQVDPAKVDDQQSQRLPNVIYKILQGPAFLGRAALC